MTIGTGAGSTVAVATTYATSKSMSAITNATEAVATLEASHGVVVGDILEITSGWGKLNGRIVRVKTVATNDVTLEGINTTNTTDYPAAAGTGTVREITAWTQISNVKQDSFSVSGGDQQFTDATPLEAVVESQMPTIRGAYTVTFAAMDSSAGLVAASALGTTKAAIRIAAPATTTYANGYWSVSDVPNLSGREVTTFKVDFASSAQPKTY
jgi:ribosomal protein L24